MTEKRKSITPMRHFRLFFPFESVGYSRRTQRRNGYYNQTQIHYQAVQMSVLRNGNRPLPRHLCSECAGSAHSGEADQFAHIRL